MKRLENHIEYAQYLSKVIEERSPKTIIYCIYFPKLRAFKVGRTNNLSRRLSSIKYDYDEPWAKVIASFNGTKLKEKDIHKKLKKYRSNTDGLETSHREVYDVSWELSEELSKIFKKPIINLHFKYCFKLTRLGVFEKGKYVYNQQ